METFTESLVVDAPADSIWRVLADYPRDPEWRTGVVSMTVDPHGPPDVGTTTHEVIRVAGRTYRNDGVVDRVVPGRSIAWHTTSGAEASGVRSVRSLSPGQCEVTLALQVVPHGVNRLLVPVLRRVLRSNLRRDLEALAAVHAGHPVPGPN
jgi:uncharacterized membrane protein